MVGVCDGFLVGIMVGAIDGFVVGIIVGIIVGIAVGILSDNCSTIANTRKRQEIPLISLEVSTQTCWKLCLAAVSSRIVRTFPSLNCTYYGYTHQRKQLQNFVLLRRNKLFISCCTHAVGRCCDSWGPCACGAVHNVCYSWSNLLQWMATFVQHGQSNDTLLAKYGHSVATSSENSQ